jgi:hypothetical protein
VIELRDKQTGTFLGHISEEQLQFLIDQLEEEWEEDMDYYINPATLQMFEAKGIDQDFLEMLRKGLGNRDSMEIEWSRK